MPAGPRLALRVSRLLGGRASERSVHRLGGPSLPWASLPRLPPLVCLRTGGALRFSWAATCFGYGEHSSARACFGCILEVFCGAALGDGAFFHLAVQRVG
eukprot:2747215-Alexandrium_andersonii.AAC.1